MVIRSLAALIYDLFIITALCFFFAGIVVFFNHGQAIAPATRWFQATLLVIIFLYFYFSLRQGGQTIGMRAWRLQWNRGLSKKESS